MSDFITVHRPVAFPGTDAEREANHRTHLWTYYDEARCSNCDAKPWHVAADYPCGQEPPRETVQVAR